MQAFDVNHTRMPLDDCGDIVVSLKGYCCGSELKSPRPFVSAELRQINTELEQLGYDIRVPFEAATLLPAGEREREVALETIARAIDLLGGVEFDVPVAMHYEDPYQDLYIDLQPGKQHLDGQSAAHLLRFRSGYYNADLGRVEIQQEFVKALAEQCLQLSKLPKLGSVVSVLSEELVSNLTTGNLAWLGLQLLQTDDLQTHTMPGSADGIYLQGQNYYVIYGLDTLALINESYSPLKTEITLDDVEMMRLSGQAIVYADGSFYALPE